MARPSGVRLIRPDGPPIDLDDDLVHNGVDEEGMDDWAIGYTDFRPGIDKIECDVLPGRTSLGFAVRADRLPGSGDLEAKWEDATGEVTYHRKSFSEGDDLELRIEDTDPE